MKPTLFLMLVLGAFGCSSAPAESDDETSDDALVTGARFLSKIDEGIYDLPGSATTIYIGARMTQQVIHVEGRDAECAYPPIDAIDGQGHVEFADKNCELKLGLKPVAGGLSVQGQVTIRDLTQERARYSKATISGVASRRPKNALVGTYVAGVVTLNVTASDDDRLFGSIRMPAETVSFEARSGFFSASLAALDAVFGTTRTAMYEVKLSEQCTGWLTVDRSAVGEFAPHTSSFGESCPKPLQQFFLQFKRTR